jgi:hypothetical protein
VSSLINRKACKALALNIAKDSRKGWHAERVSKEFLDSIEYKVKHIIEIAVYNHPTVGRTIKDIL